jgi:hypothetical protein
LLGAELAKDPDAELADEIVDGALELYAELAVGGDELEAAVNTGHGADGDEAFTGAAWQALYHCRSSRRRGVVALLGWSFEVRVGQALAR